MLLTATSSHDDGNLLRLGLHRSLAPVAAKAMITRHAVRGIIDYPMNSYESSLYGILLHKSDLPPFDDNYFRVLAKEYFIEKYGDAESIFIYESAPPSATQQVRIPKRLAAVLPLDVKNHTNSIHFGFWSSWRRVPN